MNQSCCAESDHHPSWTCTMTPPSVQSIWKGIRRKTFTWLVLGKTVTSPVKNQNHWVSILLPKVQAKQVLDEQLHYYCNVVIKSFERCARVRWHPPLPSSLNFSLPQIWKNAKKQKNKKLSSVTTQTDVPLECTHWELSFERSYL